MAIKKTLKEYNMVEVWENNKNTTAKNQKYIFFINWLYLLY